MLFLEAEMKTSLYSILCIAIRVGAVIWMAGSLAHLPFSWLAAENSKSPIATVAWLLFGTGFQLFITAILWLYPGVLARLAAGRGSLEYFESTMPTAKLQYVALSVVGAWFALQGIVFLSYELVETIRFASESVEFKWAVLAESGARLVFGIALLLGARGLTRLLNGIRERGESTRAVDGA